MKRVMFSVILAAMSVGLLTLSSCKKNLEGEVRIQHRPPPLSLTDIPRSCIFQSSILQDPVCRDFRGTGWTQEVIVSICEGDHNPGEILDFEIDDSPHALLYNMEYCENPDQYTFRCKQDFPEYNGISYVFSKPPNIIELMQPGCLDADPPGFFLDARPAAGWGLTPGSPQPGPQPEKEPEPAGPVMRSCEVRSFIDGSTSCLQFGAGEWTAGAKIAACLGAGEASMSEAPCAAENYDQVQQARGPAGSGLSFDRYTRTPPAAPENPEPEITNPENPEPEETKPEPETDPVTMSCKIPNTLSGGVMCLDFIGEGWTEEGKQTACTVGSEPDSYHQEACDPALALDNGYCEITDNETTLVSRLFGLSSQECSMFGLYLPTASASWQELP